jgi:tight adherence protein B
VPAVINIIIMAVVFTAILAISQSLYWAWIVRREAEQRELARRLGTMAEEQYANLFRDHAADAAAQALGNLGLHLQETLDQADSPLMVGSLLLRMAAIAGVGALLFLLVLGPMGVLIGLVLGIIPYFLLRRQGQQRARKLLEQLPDALDLMARSLQAGLGLNDAFRMCAEEMHLPVAAEFGRVFEEVRFGRDHREALTNMVKRNPALFDLRLFVSSVLLQRETGGNLIEILENISNTIRQRFLFDAKVKAMTSEAKFSAYILGSLPLLVALLIAVSNPQYLRPLVDDSLGNMMVAYCIFSYGLGVYLMRMLSQVEA